VVRRWLVAYLVMIVVPLAMSVAGGRLLHESLTAELSLSTGLVAASLLVAAFALPSRLRMLTSHLGIETLLRNHRAVAMTAAVLALLHVGLVLAADPHRFGVLDLRSAPPRVWAGSVATVALVLLVVLALSRRKRRVRYEGWRLVHIALSLVVVGGTALHVWWLQHLVLEPDMAAWFGLLLVVVLGLIAYRWGWRPFQALRRAYVVDDVRPESTTAVKVVLRARGHEGVPFRAGQFAWLKFGGSPFTFEEHPFTIASTATQPWRKEFTIKALGDFTELVSSLRPGRRVYLDGPHGQFTFDDLRAPGFVFVAGGVGVTPMLSMLRTLADQRDRRPCVLFVGGRTSDDLLHRDEIAELATRLPLRVVEVVATPHEDWAGERGYITKEMITRHVPGRRQRRRLHWFLCGPPVMVTAVLGSLDGLGVPRHSIHTELFDMV